MVNKKPQVVLYVEGGGDSESLHNECRKGFRLFLEHAGLSGNMPRIVACGSRNDAYDSFVTACSLAIKNGRIPVLLVDSEASVSQSDASDSDCKKWTPWNHLKNRDSWDMPNGASEEQCNLMVECMENWFAADVPNLKRYYGHGFDEKRIPVVTDIETIHKVDMYAALDDATKNTKTKGKYSKGGHSFEILALIDSSLVLAKSRWAKRFVEYLKSL